MDMNPHRKKPTSLLSRFDDSLTLDAKDTFEIIFFTDKGYGGIRYLPFCKIPVDYKSSTV